MRAARRLACQARRSRPPPFGSRPPRCCPPPARAASRRSPAAARTRVRSPPGMPPRPRGNPRGGGGPLPCRYQASPAATGFSARRQRSAARSASARASDQAPCSCMSSARCTQAASREGDQVGLALAPVGQGGGPLLGAANLVGVLASQDHAAIDDPGGDRGELAGGDRHHRLVEQRQTLLEAPEPDQDVALLVGGEGEQVRVAEALADRRRLCRGCGGRLEVAARLLLEDDREQQVAALNAVAPLVVEQPLGAAEPAAGAARSPRQMRGSRRSRTRSAGPQSSPASR